MFGIRRKLSLGFGGLLLVLAVVGAQSIFGLIRLGASIDVILRENYRSVIAAQRMKEALERIDSGTLFTLLGYAADGRALIARNEAEFEDALRVELGNVTLPGEGDLAVRVRDLYGDYKAVLADRVLSGASRPVETYFSTLLPLFGRIKATADGILDMNQRNMAEANDRARRTAAEARRRMYVLLAAGAAIAALFIVLTGRWIVRPIDRLTRSAEEISRGNLDLVVEGEGADEIGRLSAAFNAMAANLRRFRRSDEARFQRVQQATQRAFDSLPDALAIVDPEGRIEVSTPTARTLFGLTPGLRLADVPAKDLGSLVAMVLETRTPRGAEGMSGDLQRFTGGRERFFRPEAVPILDAERQPSGAILALRDVTQLRQQDEIKRGVIATVSHQLRTPLTSIRMALHLLLEENVGPLNEKQAELVAAARDDGERLHAILHDLLDMSRIEAGRAALEVRPVSPRDLAGEALDAVRREARERGVDLVLDVPDDLPAVRVDASRAGHVFANLLTNALQHTDPGGKVALRAAAEDGFVRFSVADTGRGIPAEALPRVFEPFFRVPGGGAGGVGLGLAIVKEIVEAHGGTVRAESAEGRGTTISFTLPAEAPARRGEDA